MLSFKNVTFSQNVRFHHCSFEDGNHFFTNCNFSKLLSFTECQLNNVFGISSCSFDGPLKFSNIKSRGIFAISLCSFKNKIEFYAGNFKAMDFLQNTLHSKLTIVNTSLKGARISNCDFSNGVLEFNSVKTSQESEIEIRNTNINQNAVFKRCDMDRISFQSCEIQNVTFLYCNWKPSGRIVILDEIYLRDEKLKSKTSILEVESLYRQLKLNYSSSKNWEMSGYAYNSEMEMRKSRLKSEKNWPQFIIYWIYKELGGYTQDYITPLKYLGWLFLISFIIYGSKLVSFDLFEIIQMSITKILFLLKTPDILEAKIESSDYKRFFWVFGAVTQFMSATLTTFLILALRKRFKQ